MVLIPFFCKLHNISLSTETKKNTATLTAEESLKSLYSRLGFKVIRDFLTSTNFEKFHKLFSYNSGKFKAFQKQTIGLQCYKIIPRYVTIIYEKLIDFNENKDLFKDLNEVLPSDYWFP